MLNIFTIVLDGGEYLKRHLPIFEQLTIPWKWSVVEGAAGNTADTAWCKPQPARLSQDGSHEYLMEIQARNPNVLVACKPMWANKTVMCNAAMEMFSEPGILLQVDSDEIWTVAQLEEIMQLFRDFPQVGSMRFNCNYFVGPDLVAVGQDAWGGNDNSWLRAWRYTPGMKFLKHEPPVLEGSTGYCMTRHETARCGLVFDHFSYATESQVAYKASFYGPAYANAVEGWRRLQAHQDFPTPLRQFFGWLKDDRTMVQKYEKDTTATTTTDRRSTGDNGTSVRFCPIGKEERTEGAQERTATTEAQKPVEPIRFAHAGDAGDCISACPAVRAIVAATQRPATFVITDGAWGQRQSMKGTRYEALRPLLMAQSYIQDVVWEDRGERIDYDFRGFRANRDRRQSLAENHAQQVRTDIRLDPWLEVGEVEPHGRVVFARSSRYQNGFFPWTELAKHYGSKAVFVGLEVEHQAFQKHVGRSIEYRRTADLLELARFIAGANLVYANQSLPAWCAHGCGVRMALEIWPRDSNTIVPRDNAFYPMTAADIPGLWAWLARG